MITVSGRNNTLGMPIFLPEINPANRICVNETTGGTLTLAEVPGFALTIAPGSATFPGGSRSGCVSVTPVNMDKVPMSPGFGQQPRFVVTIQPAGTHFSPAARMTIPNVDGLAPRAVTEMYSYDHDLASFVAIGSATVSADGATITSDPGSGVIKAGWHCGGNPNTTGSAGTCPACNKCEGASCVADNGQTPPQASPTDCKEQYCDGGSVANRNKDSEKTDKDCKECKNGAPSPMAGQTPNPNDEVSCCFEGNKIPNVAPSYDLLMQQCSPALRSQNKSLRHIIDGCSNSPDNPMAVSNPLTQLNRPGTSTAFGSEEANPPMSGSGAPGRDLPCNWHDVGYQTCGRPQATSDADLRTKAEQVCDVAYRLPNPYPAGSENFTEFAEERTECMGYATTYYNVLQQLGGSAFRERQQQYCTCCRPINAP